MSKNIRDSWKKWVHFAFFGTRACAMVEKRLTYAYKGLFTHTLALLRRASKTAFYQRSAAQRMCERRISASCEQRFE